MCIGPGLGEPGPVKVTMGDEIQVVPRGCLESGTSIVGGGQKNGSSHMPSHAARFLNFAHDHARAGLTICAGESARDGIL